MALSTEGRIYAQQLMREVKRREAIGAAAFKAKTWDEGATRLFNRVTTDWSIFTENVVHQTHKRLMAIPEGDRGFSLNGNTFDMVTLTAGGHTLTVMEDLEDGIIAQRQTFMSGNISACIVVANISTHALGRFKERTTYPITIEDGMALAGVCGYIGMMAASQPHLVRSEINLLTDGCMVTGSMKVAGYPGTEIATACFDCRTALPLEACTEEQFKQSEAIRACINHNAKMKDIPYIERRTDFVLETLAASKRPKH
jgi:hypothetical protein